MAKEVVVSTMGVIFGNDLQTILLQHFNVVSAYAFLVFVLLYTPCITTVATMTKEYGNKMMFFSIVYQFILAWIAAFIVYNLGLLIIG